MKTILILSFLFICISSLKAQEDLDQQLDELVPKNEKIPVTATFKSPQIINGQSNETVHKHDLLFVVMHRFNDIAGQFGGIKTFYGLDNATDFLIGFDYGITDRLSFGFGRTKGSPNVSNSQTQLFYIKPKYRLIRQSTDNHMPVSVTLFGNAVVSGMERQVRDTLSDANFQKFTDRMSFVAQAIITRKFSDNLSLALVPTYVRSNYVRFMDMNDLFALGMGGRLKISHRMALIADYFLSFRSKESKNYYFLHQNGFKFYNPLGIGLELETGGHVFNFIFTNSTAILENQFIPSTSSTWTNGGFRWGFSISRTFTLFKM